MKYDLDISIDEKLRRLEGATIEIGICEMDYARHGESALQVEHVADYENWKMTNKRGKR